MLGHYDAIAPRKTAHHPSGGDHDHDIPLQDASGTLEQTR